MFSSIFFLHLMGFFRAWQCSLNLFLHYILSIFQVVEMIGRQNDMFPPPPIFSWGATAPPGSKPLNQRRISRAVYHKNRKLSQILHGRTVLFNKPLSSCIQIIGFPGQIRKFDNQIHFNFIQIRQIMSCRKNYNSNSFSYHSI